MKNFYSDDQQYFAQTFVTQLSHKLLLKFREVTRV